MAEIQMRESETDEDRMPEVCMVCGQTAHAHVRKLFSWHPPWVVVLALVGLLPYVLVAAILTKRMTIYMPVCKRHRSYWWKRYLLMYLPLLAFAAVSVAAGFIASKIPAGQANPAGFVCLGSAVVGFVWLIIAAVLQSFMIRAKEIADGTITLKNVHEDFVEAFYAIRKKHRQDFDRSYEEGVSDYDEKLRRRRQRWADRRTGHGDDESPDGADSYRLKPDDD